MLTHLNPFDIIISVLYKIQKEIVRLIEKQEPFVLCSVINTAGSAPAKVGAKMLVYKDGSQLGTIGGSQLELNVKKIALEAIQKKQSQIYEPVLSYKKNPEIDVACGGKMQIFIEYFHSKPYALLCGGGHINHEVSKFLDNLEYFYAVLDNRPEFCTRDRFPSARELFNNTPEEHLTNKNKYSHVVICNYSEDLDFRCLDALAKIGFCGYVGMIGSRAKRNDFFKRLQTKGVTQEYLNKIECPVGLQIHSTNIHEIALSMVASIVKNYNEQLKS